MKARINLLIKQLEDLYSGRNWVAVEVESLLENIPAGTAIRKKLPNRHSILEILQHIIAWRTFLLKRLQGDRDFNLSQNDGVEWIENSIPDAALWEETRQSYKTLHRQIIDELQQHDDELLSRIVDKRTYNFQYLIQGVIQHDYYHFGQISLLR